MPVYQVTTLQTLVGQEIRNVYYYETAGVLSTSQLEEAVEEIANAYVVLEANTSLVPEWSVRGANFRRVDVPQLPGIDFFFDGGPIVGSDTEDPLPTQVCILISGKAYTAPPRNVRTYHGGMHHGLMFNNGTWLGSTVTAFELWVAEMDILTLTGESMFRVAASWAADHSEVTAWNRIIQYEVSFNPATQRRRRLGEGI